MSHYEETDIKTKNILIDVEFTGLDNTYITDNEIVQVKVMDADSGVGVCVNFKASKPVSIFHRVTEGLTGDYKGRTVFSSKEFAKLLRKIGVEPDDRAKFFGYSVSMDKTMLLKYGLDIEIIDLQELLRRNPMYELDLASGCSSMEAAYFLLTGKRPNLKSHLKLSELILIREIYERVVEFKDLNEVLTLMPYGHCSGMPIGQYVSQFRRAADGYRFNNSDLLAKSLTAKIPTYTPTSWTEDDDINEDDDDEDDY